MKEANKKRILWIDYRTLCTGTNSANSAPSVRWMTVLRSLR